MAAPIITVEGETEVGEIARLLTTHRINRVPVVRDGQVVGIVSRADLLRTLCAPVALIRGDKDGVAGTGALP